MSGERGERHNGTRRREGVRGWEICKGSYEKKHEIKKEKRSGCSDMAGRDRGGENEVQNVKDIGKRRDHIMYGEILCA